MPANIKGYILKDGKLVKRPRKLSVSERQRQKHSKRQRVVPKAKAGRT